MKVGKPSLWSLSVSVLFLSLPACTSPQKELADELALEEAEPVMDLTQDEATAPAEVAKQGETATQVAQAETESAPPPATPDASTEAVSPQPEATQREPASQNPPEMTPQPEGVRYRVKPGDTLMKIAFETYGDFSRWREIQAKNSEAVGGEGRLTEGLTLLLDAPATPFVLEQNGQPYRIRTGDTLGSISQEVYQTRSKWRKIFENNRQLIKDPNKIYAGFTLYYLPEQNLAALP